MAPPNLPNPPAELIYLIADHLPNPSHLSALARTNRRLYGIINNILYIDAVKPGKDPKPLLWAVRVGVPPTIEKAICAGAKPDHLYEYHLSRKAWELVCNFERAIAPNPHSDEFDDWKWVTPNINTYGHADDAGLYHDLHDIMGAMRAPWDPRPGPPPNLSAHPNPLLALLGTGQPNQDQDDDLSETEPLPSEPDGPLPLPFPPGAGAGVVGAFLGSLFQAVQNHNQHPLNDDDDDDEDDEDDDDDLMDQDSEVEDWVHNIRARGITRRCAPIHIAAKEGHNDAIEKLLEHGANIHLEAEWYCSCRPPLTLWETRELEAAGTLRENLEASYWPAVHIAMCFSRFDTAKYLIERGALNNTPNTHLGFTVLHQAAYMGNLEMLQYIVEAGKNTWHSVDIEDDMGLTPLYFACAKGHWDKIVPYLIKQGADIDKEFEVDLWEFKAKTTLLGEACYLGHYSRALKLIELGANVRQELEFDQLTFGRRHRLDEADDQDEEAVDGIKKIPLIHVCCTSPRTEDDDGYYSTPTMRSTPFRLARTEEPTALERVTLIQKLLDAGTPVDQTWADGNGETPLFMAAHFHVTSAVRALLKAGANPLVQDKSGRNALMAALHHPHSEEPWTTFSECFPLCARNDKVPEIVRLLLEAGVPVNHQDSQGRTALHLVFRPRRSYELGPAADALCSIVRLLFDAGIDPCIRDKDDTPVIKGALKWEYGRAADLLVQFHGPTIGSQLTATEFREYYLMIAEATPPRLYSYGLPESASSYDLLLDIDRSHHLTSDKSLLFDLLSKGAESNGGECLQAAEKLAKRGLHRMDLTFKEKIWVIKKSIDNDMYRMLIEAVNVTVHAVDPSVLRDRAVLEGALLHILRHHRRMSFSEPMIAHLINAGADLHRACPHNQLEKEVSAGASAEASAEASDVATPAKCWSPLYTAICYGQVKVVKYMLSKQPIRGKAHASFTPYLHLAVNFDPAVKERWPITVQQDEAKTRTDMVRALIDAGADPTLINQSKDTALTMLLKGLAADPDRKLLKTLGPLIKPLSQGVDINVINADKRTAAMYLEELLTLKKVDEKDKDRESSSEPKQKVKRINEAVKLLRARVELVPVEEEEQGRTYREVPEGGWKKIKWLVPKGMERRGPLCPVPVATRERERYMAF